MASSVALHIARQRLSELLDRAERGENILIERPGHVAMKLVPVVAAAGPDTDRVGGQNLLGITYIEPDINEPMSIDELKQWGF